MWPDDRELPVEVQAAFGADLTASPGTWSWTDLSSRVQAEQIRIRAGRSDGARSVSPSTCTIALTNDDGALTPRNPMSPYWPGVQRGTPVRVRIQHDGVWRERFSGFADQWRPTFLPTTTPGDAHSVTRVTASGLLRRLEQGARPARSSPARFIPTTNPVAYWPLEDGELVSEGAALVGGQPMRPFVGTHPSGAVITFTQWGRGDLAPWLPQALSRTGNHGLAIVWAPVSMPTTSRWVVDFMYRSGTDAGDSAVDINPAYLGGSLGWPQLALLPEFRGVDVAMNGEPEVQGTASTLFDGKAHHVRWDVYQNGSKVSWNVYVDAVQVNFGTTSGNMTLPPVQSIGLTAGAQAGADMAQGHVAVWTSPPPVEDAVAAALGHAGETAATRIARLCAEEGVSISVASGDSEPMGPQPVAGLMELLRQAEEADMGLLFESGFGLSYRPRSARYNPPAAMVVDLAAYRVSQGGAGDVLTPSYDDQGLRNEWTVGRIGGQAPVTVLDAAHQERSGVYSDSAELNIASDGPLADHASWRVHLGTVDDLRESTFPIDLAANPDLLDGWLSCGVGSRIVRSNPPAQYGAGPLDTLVDGWTETIAPRSWMVQVTPTAADVWDVATVDGEQRVAADGSRLAASLTGSGTSLLLVSTADNGPWTTDPADMPLDIRVGGERVTASLIDNGDRDEFNGTITGSWGTTDAGRTWTHLGSSSAFRVGSGSGWHLHTALNTGRHSLIDIGVGDHTFLFAVAPPVMAAGMPLTAYAISRVDPVSPTANQYQVRIAFLTDGRVTCTVRKRVAGIPDSKSNIDLPGPYSPGQFWFVKMQTAGATVRGKVWPTSAPEPPGWMTEWVDPDPLPQSWTQIGVTTLTEPGSTNTHPIEYPISTFQVLNPQRITLAARGVNGFQRTWPAGTDVDVWQPAVLAL